MRVFGFIFCFLFASCLFASDQGDHEVISNIAVSIVSAAVLGLGMKILKQPLMLGYLIAGVLIGPHGFQFIDDYQEITTIAEIGLILLLFMIGLEIDLKKMLSAGKLVIVTGVFQFPLSVAVALSVNFFLASYGIIADDFYVQFYLAVGISISSTMVVVKLLYEKMELSTLPGRITVGILVFQDIWAIIFLAIQPNLANPQLLCIARTFGVGVLLVLGSVLCAKYVLPIIFKFIAKVPELLVIMALAWCFLIALIAAHPFVGLSMEMGALIAGVTLATFPYHLDIIAKVLNIRDFFITLFFVALGMQIPIPNFTVLIQAILLSALVIFLRYIGVFWILNLLRGGLRTSTIAGLNLSQISEFSLVILTLGIVHGHIGRDTLVIVIWVFVLMAVFSSYAIKYSHPLQQFFSQVLIKIGFRDLSNDEDNEIKDKRPVVLLGMFKIGSSFLDKLIRYNHQLADKIMVIDFNPVVQKEMNRVGIPYKYADISNPDTLVHIGISHAEVVICSIEDVFLKGITNLKLIEAIQRACPNAKVIVTGDNSNQSIALYDSGADLVLHPSALAADHLIDSVMQVMENNHDQLKKDHLNDLESHRDFLT